MPSSAGRGRAGRLRIQRPDGGRRRRHPTVRSKSSSTDRWRVIFPAVLASASALLGTGVGASIAATVNKEISATSLQEQRSDEARQLRIDAYQGYLAAADADDNLRTALWTCYVTGSKTENDKAKYSRCANIEKGADSAAGNLAKAMDPLLVYGTGDVLRIAREVLDREATRSEKDGSWYIEVPLSGGLDNPYGKLRTEFQRQMCRDLNPLPRGDC